MIERDKVGATKLAAERLGATAEEARAAEQSGDWRAANDAWRRYRLIADAQRDPDDLLADGIRLSRLAIELARST
ncbi:MAG: hypothetical protein ACR2ML_00480 [Solirubrobacteraceae bacterium]